MAVVTRKRPKNLSVSKSALDQAGSLLQDLPQKAKEDLSLREAVDQLQEQVKAALAKGYSYDEVATLLDGKGIEISASTLKRYVSLSSRQTKSSSTKVRTGRPRKSQTAAPAVATPPEQAAANQKTTAVASAPAPVETAAEKPAKGRRKSTTAAAEPKPVKTSRPRSTAAKAAPAQPTKSSATRGRKKASS
ncbi:MAG TPA: hypothetical protein V6C57_19265 [Coleofasciculaceae cyanobacterium]